MKKLPLHYGKFATFTVFFLTLLFISISPVNATNTQLNFRHNIKSTKLIEKNVDHLGTSVNYLSMYDLPVDINSIEKYANKYSLHYSLKKENLKLTQSSGSACAHSPICVIVLPFELLDMMSGYIDYDVVTFTQKNKVQLTVFYLSDGGQIARVVLPLMAQIMSINYSHTLNSYIIETIAGKEVVELSERLFSAFPLITEQKELQKFEGDALTLPYSPPPWIQAAQLIKTQKYTIEQRKTLLNLMCSTPPTNEMANNVVSNSVDLKETQFLIKILQCVSTYSRQVNENETTGFNSQRVEKIFTTIFDKLCHNELDVSPNQHQKIRTALDLFSLFFSEKSPRELINCQQRFFNIYLTYQLDKKISIEDYIFAHETKKEELMEFINRIPIKIEHVIAARLRLILDKKLSPNSTLDALIDHEILLKKEFYNQLVSIYSMNNYPSKSLFSTFMTRDNDISKQVSIIELLNKYSDDELCSLGQLIPNLNRVAKTALLISICEQVPIKSITQVLHDADSQEEDITSSWQVSLLVDDQSTPKNADLVWYALSFNQELKQQVISNLAQEKKPSMTDAFLQSAQEKLLKSLQN